MKRKFAWTAALVLLIAAAGAAWWWSTRSEGGKAEYRTAKIERGTVTAVVAASGSINPVASVQVSSQVSGQLKEVLADYNSEVRQGQVLARIDPETFRLRVNQAQADLDAAQAQVLVQESQVSQRNAELSRVQVNLAETRRDLERKEELVAKNYISVAERDRVAALARIGDEDLKTARAGVQIALAQVKNSQALVKQRQAALDSARVDLERTVIRSPVDGVVIKRAVDAGQTVAASLQAPEMFLIARNLRDMQVDTSIDESDISRVRVDQKASFTVDAFPSRTFEGTVTQVRKAAQNIQNVVTYVVVVTFSNADGALQPGMTANVRVITEVRRDVLKIANGALRFRPPGETVGVATAGAAPAGGGEAVRDAAAPAAAPTPGSQGAAGAPVAAADSAARVAGAGVARSGAKGTAAGTSAAPGANAPSPALPGAGASAAPGAGGGAGGGGGGGQLSSFRERLEQELAPTAEQRQKLESIFGAAREKFRGLREMPEEQRSALFSTYRAELRAAVAEILTPEQKKRYDALLQDLAANASASSSPVGPKAGPETAAAPKSAPAAPKAAAGAPPTTGTSGGTAAGGGAGGGQLAAFRERLDQELALTPQQRQQLDTIFAGVREKLMGLRAMPEEQRGKLAQGHRAELRAMVTEILTPEQRKRYEVLLGEIAGRAGAGGRGRIYVLENGKPRAVTVRTGISDGTATEVSGEGLAEGAEVIIGIVGRPGSMRPAGSSLPRLL